MRILAVVLSLLVACAAPAEAQNKHMRKDFIPKYVFKFELLPGNPPQGLWRFGNGQYLMSQDADGGKGHEWMRFLLFDKDGDFIRKWEVNYGAHGQSMFVKWEDGGFTIFTESRDRHGIGIFRLTEERTKLIFVRQVTPKLPNGQPVEFSAFGVDEENDLIVLGGGGQKVMRYFKFSDFKEGILTRVEKKVAIEPKGSPELGWLQGVGTHSGVVYALTGTAELDDKKYIVRIGEDGEIRRMSIGPSRGKATFKYEPESLFVQDGKIMFTMHDHFWTRLYEMKAE